MEARKNYNLKIDQRNRLLEPKLSAYVIFKTSSVNPKKDHSRLTVIKRL